MPRRSSAATTVSERRAERQTRRSKSATRGGLQSAHDERDTRTLRDMDPKLPAKTWSPHPPAHYEDRQKKASKKSWKKCAFHSREGVAICDYGSAQSGGRTPGGSRFCAGHAHIAATLDVFAGPSGTSVKRFLHFYGGVPLEKDAIQAFERLSSKNEISQDLLDLLGGDFKELKTSTTKSNATEYVLPEELIRLNAPNSTGKQVKGAFRVLGHKALAAFFKKYQEIEHDIASLGGGKLNPDMLLRLEGTIRSNVCAPRQLPLPLGGIYVPHGWKISCLPKGETVMSEDDLAELRITYHTREGERIPASLISKTDTTVGANRVDLSKSAVKVFNNMYPNQRDVAREQVFFDDVKKPDDVENIGAGDTTDNDVFLGLIPLFFELVEGNEHLMDLLREKRTEYEGATYDEQQKVSMGILRQLRDTGARILRVQEDTVENGIGGVMFDDVGDQFFVEHVCPYLFEWHEGVEGKEPASDYKETRIENLVLAQCFVTESVSIAKTVQEWAETLARVMPERKPWTARNIETDSDYEEYDTADDDELEDCSEDDSSD